MDSKLTVAYKPTKTPDGLTVLAPSDAHAEGGYITKVPLDRYIVTPRGLSYEGAGAGVMVFPFSSSSLGFEAKLNNRPVHVVDVFGGAMSGVLVPEGPYSLDLKLHSSVYQACLAAQALAFLIACLACLRPRARSGMKC